MADDSYDDDDQTQEQEPEPSRRSKKRQEEQAELERLQSENARLQRENLMHSAGVDTSTPLGRLIQAGYSGPDDVDAIKAFAKEVGATGAPQGEAPAPEIDPAEVQATDERRRLASGAQVTEPPAADPRQVAVRRGQEVLQAGGKFEDAFAAGFETLAKAAIAGDERALWYPGKDIDPVRMNWEIQQERQGTPA